MLNLINLSIDRKKITKEIEDRFLVLQNHDLYCNIIENFAIQKYDFCKQNQQKELEILLENVHIHEWVINNKLFISFNHTLFMYYNKNKIHMYSLETDIIDMSEDNRQINGIASELGLSTELLLQLFDLVCHTFMPNPPKI